MPDIFTVIRMGSLGDVLLTTGVLRYWNRTSGCRFNVVTRQDFSEIFKNHPGVIKTVPARSQDLTHRGWWNFCLKLKKDSESIKLIDLHANLRTAVLKSIWKGKVHTYSKKSIARRMFAKTGLRSFQAGLLKMNVPQRYAAALSLKVPEQSVLRPEIFLESAEKNQAMAKLSSLGLEKNIICIHPYATHQAKTWPADKWNRLLSELEYAGYGWVIIGRHDFPLQPAHPGDLTNQTSIRETGAIISCCQALISGDSGPMHLGTSVGTPVIGLFGPTGREWGFYPSGPADTVIEPDLPCRPCSLHGRSVRKCGAKCMDMLEPGKVARVLPAILSDGQSSTRNAGQ